jgi:hypothetical protein
MLRTRYITLLSVGWNNYLHSLLLAGLLGSLGDLTASTQILQRLGKRIRLGCHKTSLNFIKNRTLKLTDLMTPTATV